MKNNKVWKEFLELPPEAQKEIEDFIAFLKRRYSRNVKKGKQNISAWRKESFIGMWEYREDMKDSTQWIREIRKSQWKLTK